MKRELIYAAAVGGCVGALMTMALGLVLPLGAQNEVRDAEFGKIICSELNVVGTDRLGLVMIGGDEFGGRVDVHGKGNKSVASLHIDEFGGRVGVIGKEAKAVAMMMIGETSGRVTVVGKKDEVATLAIDGVKRSDER